jgi:hypothetical protein
MGLDAHDHSHSTTPSEEMYVTSATLNFIFVDNVEAQGVINVSHQFKEWSTQCQNALLIAHRGAVSG